MQLSRKWLDSYVKIEATSKEYADVMTLAGSKVELTRELSDEIKNVVAGRVTSMERHPDADHLWICQIDAGKESDVQIVTGAQNVRVGDLVPVALHKSRLPDGRKIEKGRLRGVASNGMLCSLGELGLDTHDFPGAADPTEGIFIITEDAETLKPGDDIRTYVGADDSIVEFEITGNRPDCLSVIGLARESAVSFNTELTLPVPVVNGGGGSIDELLKIEILNPELCPRYTAKMVKNIKIAPSPKWMRQRLRASGVRPINNIVDITNYVMLEYGQPMHAFDYKCLGGGKIVVRTARPDETMNTLDGTPRSLSPDMLVIADAEKAVGIAGVMGGENSEITDGTALVVFESANFNGVSIRRTASALGMRTDASGRFEKGLDVENTLPAVLRACQLVEELGVGEVLDGTVDIRAEEYRPLTLRLEPEKINRLLGADISVDFMTDILRKLGFAVENGVVAVPSWRGDIEHYTDLAEEIARFYGYNNIEPTLFGGDVSGGGLTETQRFERLLTGSALALGYDEIYTYSFIGASDYDRINLTQDAEERRAIRILNPLGEDRALMRTTALPSMLTALSNNSGARNGNVRLFEIAKLYQCGEPAQMPEEYGVLMLGAYGNCDFYTVKSAVENLLYLSRTPGVTFKASSDSPSFHPGRYAEIYSGDTKIGCLGQIHPLVAKIYGLPETYTAELNVPLLFELRSPEPKYTPLPKYPALTRDIALVCDISSTVAELSGVIEKFGGKLLRQCVLFDVYTGSQVPDGKKSVAFSLVFRDNDRTLTDAEADSAVEKILTALKEELNAVIR